MKDSNSSVKISSNVFILFSIFIVSLLVGLRYDVGVDYLAYKEMYEVKISDDFFKSIDECGVEPLFILLCVLLHKLCIPYYGMFVVMTFIPMFFFYLSFKDSPKILLPAIYILFASPTFFLYLNIMRHGISFFILLYAIQFIINKQFFKYLFFVFIASGFHTTSLLFIPLYCLSFVEIKINYFVSLVLYLSSLIFAGYIFPLLLDLSTKLVGYRYEGYLNVIEVMQMDEGSGFGLFAITIADLMLIIISKLCFSKFSRERYDVYFFIFLMGSILTNIAGFNMLLNRLPFSFVSMRIIVASFSIYYVFKFWKNISVLYKFSLLIFLLCISLYFLGNIISTKYSFIEM